MAEGRARDCIEVRLNPDHVANGTIQNNKARQRLLSKSGIDISGQLAAGRQQIGDPGKPALHRPPSVANEKRIPASCAVRAAGGGSALSAVKLVAVIPPPTRAKLLRIVPPQAERRVRKAEGHFAGRRPVLDDAQGVAERHRSQVRRRCRRWRRIRRRLRKGWRSRRGGRRGDFRAAFNSTLAKGYQPPPRNYVPLFSSIWSILTRRCTCRHLNQVLPWVRSGRQIVDRSAPPNRKRLQQPEIRACLASSGTLAYRRESIVDLC